MPASASLISTGVFLRKPWLAPEPSWPSSSARPPAPPVIGLMAAMMRRPVRSSVVLTFMIGPPDPGAPASRSGAAGAKAPRMSPWSRLHERVRIPTAAGNAGFTMVPDGRMQRHTRPTPVLR